jgi:hypothetical protein
MPRILRHHNKVYISIAPQPTEFAFSLLSIWKSLLWMHTFCFRLCRFRSGTGSGGEGEFEKSMASWNNGHAVLQRERLSFVKVPAGGGEKQQPSLMAPPCRPPASPRRLQSYAFKEFTYRCKRTEDPHTTILYPAYGGVPLCVISSQITNTREIMRKNQKTSTKAVMETSSLLRRCFRCVGLSAVERRENC